MQLPYDPAVAFLDIYPREIQIYGHTTTCTQMFLAALFLIDQNSPNIIQQVNGKINYSIFISWDTSQQ